MLVVVIVFVLLAQFTFAVVSVGLFAVVSAVAIVRVVVFVFVLVFVFTCAHVFVHLYSCL